MCVGFRSVRSLSARGLSGGVIWDGNGLKKFVPVLFFLTNLGGVYRGKNERVQKNEGI